MKVKNIILTALAIISVAFFGTPAALAQTCDGSGSNFVDLDGDGFNDNAPDHDNDGIPNGLDEDYVKNPQDGSGYQNGKATDKAAAEPVKKQAMTKTKKFKGDMFKKRVGALGEKKGPGTGVCDGTGSVTSGTGLCDGTGLHGPKRSGK